MALAVCMLFLPRLVLRFPNTVTYSWWAQTWKVGAGFRDCLKTRAFRLSCYGDGYAHNAQKNHGKNEPRENTFQAPTFVYSVVNVENGR
jgi:hypothetical protein